MVRGISMSPTFHNNQLLFAKSINNYKDIHVNDIVICEIEENTIVKRVKYIENQYVCYYFDSNSSEIKIIDESILEPVGGAHRDRDLILDNVRKSIENNLKENNLFSDAFIQTN